MRYQTLTLLLTALLASCAAPRSERAPLAAGASATLALLETTDLHGNVLSYDYFKLAPDPSIGLERTATLIAQARQQFANTVLLDAGDTIQGNALGDYQASAEVPACTDTLAIYKAMNALGYAGGTLGNHDFNFGLPYLNQVTGSHFDVDGVAPSTPRCAGPRFPLVLANIDSVQSGRPLFAPYHIIDKHVDAIGADGRPVRAVVRIGIIGFTPPGILAWDKRWLDGKVVARGIVESAQRYIPQMRADGADLIVAIAHGGLDDRPYTPAMENASFHLSQVPGIDAMLIGHAHQVFPNAASNAPQWNAPGVDKVKGTVNGVPTVMANLWGKHLGVIGLHLRYDGVHWVVDKQRTTVEARAIDSGDKNIVAPDPGIAPLVAQEHAGTLEFVHTPVGKTEFRMSSYFADVGDASVIEVVNRAQADYLARFVKANLPDLAGLPVLSVSAAFKAGVAGVNDYTDVKPGNLALNNAADLYLYPNTLAGVKIDGAQLKTWLEQGARRFRRIDPSQSAVQELVDTSVASYNFDVVTADELSYEIDVTQAVGHRISGLRFRGHAVAPDQMFLVATNNYRAGGGGNVPGLDGSKTVVAAPDSNREVLIAFLRQTGTLTRAAHGAQRSWHFAKVKTAGPVVFHCPPNLLELAHAAGIDNVRQVRADDGMGKGMALYEIDLAHAP